jgi:NitT/TauT family transport system substrate-binding protein
MKNREPRVTVRKSLASSALAAFAIAMAPSAMAQTTVTYMEVIRSIFYLPSYVAMEKGYFKEEGLDVKMDTGWGTAKVIPPFISGQRDIVLLGPESQVYIENSPSPDKSKIVCQLTAKDGLLVVSRKKMAPNEFKWSMVKGKDYLDWTNGTTPQIDSLRVFKKHGIAPKDLSNYITNVASGNRDSAWMAGKGDFGTFFEPTASLIERENKGHVVASIGNEIGPMGYTVFLATDKFIAKNPKVVQGWCNGIQKAQNYVASAAPSDLAKLVKPHFMGLEYDLMLNSIKRYQGLGVWAKDITYSEQSLAKLQDIMVEGGVLKPEQKVSYSKATTKTFSENAKKAVK